MCVESRSVGDRHLRVVARRLAMHERGRPERRLADQRGAEHVRGVRPFDAIAGAELHEQIVRVLHVDVRHLLITFAGLKELRRSAERDALAGRRERKGARHPAVAHEHEVADGQRLERQHAAQRQAAGADLARGGEHAPVLRLERGEVGEQPLLIVVAGDHVPVGGEGPRRRVGARAARRDGGGGRPARRGQR
jgi:hypothetical protein